MSALTQNAVPQPGVASTEHAAAPGTVPAREPLATTTNGPAATHEADPKVVKQAEKEHKKCVLLSPPPLPQLECHQRANTSNTHSNTHSDSRRRSRRRRSARSPRSSTSPRRRRSRPRTSRRRPRCVPLPARPRASLSRVDDAPCVSDSSAYGTQADSCRCCATGSSQGPQAGRQAHEQGVRRHFHSTPAKWESADELSGLVRRMKYAKGLTRAQEKHNKSVAALNKAKQDLELHTQEHNRLVQERQPRVNQLEQVKAEKAQHDVRPPSVRLPVSSPARADPSLLPSRTGRSPGSPFCRRGPHPGSLSAPLRQQPGTVGLPLHTSPHDPLVQLPLVARP